MGYSADVTRVLDVRSKQALAAVEVQRKHPVAESGERYPTIVQVLTSYEVVVFFNAKQLLQKNLK